MDVASKLALGLPVNVNQASAEDLMMIRGIGKKTADSIVALRAQKGRIKCLEQLMEIKGIKEKKLQALKKYLYAG
jgi:competence protein ComEA